MAKRRRESVPGTVPESETAQGISTMPTGAPEERIERIPPAMLHPTPWNPRTVNEKSEAFRDLLASVKASGVKVHVLARPHPAKPGDYELLAGSRRHRAAVLAGCATIPAIVRDLNDAEAFDLTFFENAHREDLTLAEEGRAVEILLEVNGGDKTAAAAKLGVSEKWIELRAKLRQLTPAWRKLIERPRSFAVKWSVGHLVLIARLDPVIQDALLDRNTDSREYWQLHNSGEEWTVKQLAEWLNNTLLRRLANAPFSREDATLVKQAGACESCGKRASCQGRLFLEDGEQLDLKRNDRCLDPACWDRKVLAWTKQRVEQVRSEHPNAILVTTVWTCGNEDREIEKTFGSGAEHVDHFSPAKATDRGAIPALVVHGRGMGELRWLKKHQYSTERCTAKRASTLKERRAVLENKRLSVVLQQLRGLLTRASDVAEPRKGFKEIPFESLSFDLKDNHRFMAIVALAATFGTHRKNGDRWDNQPLDRVDVHVNTKHIDLWERFGKLSGDGPAGIEALWSCVCRVLAGRLYCNAPITQTDKWYGQEAERIAGLCGIDLAPLRAEAERVYPEPKGWKLRVREDPTQAGLRGRRQHAGEAPEEGAQGEDRNDDGGPQADDQRG